MTTKTNNNNNKITRYNSERSGKRKRKTLITVPHVLKYFQNTFNGAGKDNAPVLLSLGTIAQGPDLDERLQYSIRLKTVQFKLQFDIADTTNKFRLMLYRAFSPTAVVGDIMANPGVFTSVPDIKRFSKIFDEVIMLTTYVPMVKFEKTIDLDARIDYYDATSTGFIKGKLMFVYFSDSGAVNHPTITGFIRETFHDL